MLKQLIFVAFASTQTVAAQQTVQFERTVRYSETVSGNTIQVAIHRRVYDFSGHQVTGGEGDEPAKVDGIEVAGTDGANPKSLPGWPKLETVANVELKWNGKRVSVAKRLYINLLNLTLSEESIQFVPRPNGEELLIQATGGDGGASYLVSLVLRKDGNHRQYEAGYWEDGLRPFPYEIEETIGEDDQGTTIIRSFPWIEANTEQSGRANPAKPGGSP